MALKLTWPNPAVEIQLTATQRDSFTQLTGHHLVMGAAGSGRSTTVHHAVLTAVREFGVEQVWAIAASRSSASELRAKLINLNPALTPKVFTISAIAYAMLRTDLLIKTSGEINLTMLTGPAQEARIRELIASKPLNWPQRWQHAINTRVFASDLRRYLDVARSGNKLHPDPEIYNVIAQFATSLIQEAQQKSETNYIEANLASAKLIESQSMESRAMLSPSAILVDDLHDFDPSQLRLLVTLIKQTKYSLVATNSDASVLGFRGVGIETTKSYRDAVTPRVHLLEKIFRYGENIGKLAQEFLPTTAAPDLNAAEAAALRQPKYANSYPGEVIFEVAASSAIRDALIVDRIMKAKVNENLKFSDIAVIGRSFSSLGELRRALAEAAIPVEFTPDNVALAKDPAVAQLLTALELVIKPLAQADSDQLIRFTQTEIAWMSAAQLRHTARKLRSFGIYGSTVEVISAVLKEPELLSQLPFDPVLQPIRRSAAILHSLAATATTASTLAESLWWLWQAKVKPEIASQIGYDFDESWQNWPTRLAAQAKLPTAAGRRADRDLDAVLALFDAADRADRTSKSSADLSDFVYELMQQDAASEVLIQRAVTGVAVLTAHRARGREWKLVILIDLQEGVWPAGNVRESIIAPRDSHEQRARLAEERRLAAAAVTTTREKLVISIVDSKMDQGTAPSALLLNYELPPVISTAPPTLLTARGLIAQLRATAIDSTVSENLRHAAINRLGYLAKQSDIRFKPAQPSQWWFIADLTQSDQPLLSTPTDLRVSGSMLESITRCPTQWFFERKLGIKDQLVANTVIGIAIHAVAQKIVAEKLTADQAMAELTKLWPTEVFDAPWQAKVQLAEALNMVKALHVWVSENANETLGAEVSFEVLHAGLEVTLVGKIDLLQKNEKDELEVIDFKTGAAKPSKADLMEHSQLGVYQLAVGISQEMNQAQLPVSAKLIQIRARNAKDQVVEQMAPDLGDAKWLVDEIETAKSRIITEDLPARPGPHCRNCKVRNICPAVPEGDQVNA